MTPLPSDGCRAYLFYLFSKRGCYFSPFFHATLLFEARYVNDIMLDSDANGLSPMVFQSLRILMVGGQQGSILWVPFSKLGRLLGQKLEVYGHLSNYNPAMHAFSSLP